MGYRRALLVRWSRRDRLAVLVVAVTVAFLTGATVLLFAIGTQTATVAAEFDSPGSVEYIAGPVDEIETKSDEVVLPLVNIESNQSTSRTLVGVPNNATLEGRGSLRSGRGTTLGTLRGSGVERLTGPDSTTTVTVTPRDSRDSVFPPEWYVTDVTTARELGTDGALVLDTEAATESAQGTPLLGALAFFLLGTREAVGTLAATAAGAALLVAVTVYSVSRMSVRDRLSTIQVVRATGGQPRTVLGLFMIRAGGLTGVGIALGYAIGVVVASGAVNVAVAVGLPTALPVGVTREVARVLLPLYAGLGGVGILAGVLAAYPVATCPPGEVTGQTKLTETGKRPSWASLEVLSWRTLVPTTATLATFVAVVILVAGLASAAGPVFGADGVTVTEPGSNHPINSKVPEVYADALRNRGVDASAEILLFEAVDGQPFTARGVVFGPFASVTDAQLLTGEAHTNPDEAVIGEGLAETLDVQVGDHLTIGGSTRPSITRVDIVGVFSAGGATDDQLLVSLATARHLSGTPDGAVQFIRADRLPQVDGRGGTAEVVGVAPNGAVLAGKPFNATFTIRNLGLSEATVTVPIRYGDQQKSVTVTVPATTTRRTTVTLAAGAAGERRLRAGNATTTIRVRAPDELTLTGVPAELPPESEPLVRLTDATGSGVGGATIEVGDQSRRTGGDGRVRLPPLDAGTYTVEARANNRRTNATVRVTTAAERALGIEINVQPRRPSLLDQPTVQVRLSNPWNQTLVRTIGIEGPGTDRSESVRVGAGETTQIRVDLARQSPGTYTIEVAANESAAAETSYRVIGDERIMAALASSGRSESSGVSQAAEAAFGNLQVVLGALIGLAGLMTVGGTTAAFAGAVHARRRTLGVHRATGATPSHILRLVLWDAIRLGLVSAVFAVVLAQAGLALLGRLGYLTAFGVRLSPTLDPIGLVATVGGGLALTLLGAGLATVGILAAPPTALLAPSEATAGGETDG